jgi:hypothetical protein
LNKADQLKQDNKDLIEDLKELKKVKVKLKKKVGIHEDTIEELLFDKGQLEK